MKVDLHDALKASYGHKENENNILKKGYKKDTELSSHNQSVYYHPKKQKLLYTVAGTHNLSDVGTDIMHAFGKLKNTSRYKEAADVLTKSKEKYKPKKTAIVGHSIGGSVINHLGDANDKRYSLNAGYTIGQPTRKNVNSYRTRFDLVSGLAAGGKHMKTINNNSILKAHDIDTIKGKNIFI